MSSTVSLLYKQKTSDQLKGVPQNKPAFTLKFKKIWKRRREEEMWREQDKEKVNRKSTAFEIKGVSRD